MSQPRGEAVNDSAPPAGAFRARVQGGGLSFAVARDESLLRAASRAGIELPSSCRNGTCRTCMCLLLDGDISYAIEWPGLLAEEKAEGWILPCVARAESDLVLGWPRANQ
jgi:ferredoxin